MFIFPSHAGLANRVNRAIERERKRGQGGDHRKSDGLGGASGSEPFQHAGAVHLDGPHADAEIVADHLVRLACHQPVKNFALARA